MYPLATFKKIDSRKGKHATKKKKPKKKQTINKKITQRLHFCVYIFRSFFLY